MFWCLYRENGVASKVYFKGEVLTVEEDLLHEFKGHRNFASEEIPRDAIVNRTRKAISRWQWQLEFVCHSFWISWFLVGTFAAFLILEWEGLSTVESQMKE